MGNDIRLAFRHLVKRPGLAGAIILTLAIGIGANVAIWSGVYAFLLSPLPFDDADRLMLLRENQSGIDRPVSLPNFFDWQEQAETFAAMAAYRGDDAALTGSGEPVRIGTCGVSDGFFAMLGVRLAVGREFSADEHQLEGPRVAVLGHGMWQRRFGGRRDIVGQTIRLDGEPYEIVGALGSDFRLPHSGIADIWMPVERMGESLLTDRGSFSNTRAIGVLAPGATLATANAEMDTIAQRLEAAHPGPNDGQPGFHPAAPTRFWSRAPGQRSWCSGELSRSCS